MPMNGSYVVISTMAIYYFFFLWHDSADSAVEHDDSTGNANFELGENANGKPKGEVSRRISLTPFGLASYKMQGDIWVNPYTHDQERLINLHRAADSWLKQLNVCHHDFSFFTCNSHL